MTQRTCAFSIIFLLYFSLINAQKKALLTKFTSEKIIIDGKSNRLTLGQGIIIPAHARHSFNANVQFKMISTIIKSGYED